ncbi:TPA: AAA family ATPase, partial [Vibrio parahaemolyticus]|nr:AAA family ATPase [Vibrio parahaemolyticus]
MTDFDYDLILNRLKNQTALKELYESCQNGYEKLQVFRLFGIDVKNSVIQKFINETYHIENEYICQLDPSEFDLIPEYV